MTTQPQPGGRRAIDRVLDPGFAGDAPTLDLDELRRRRHLAEQEEVDLSYARRLLQGRVEVLRAQQQRLSDGGAHPPRSDADIARDLGEVLADDGPRHVHGLGRHLSVDPSRAGEHRRAAEHAVANLGLSDLTPLDADVVAGAIDQLTRIEHEVSDTRHRVQQVMDVLTAEVARRYRTGEAKVEDVLTST